MQADNRRNTTSGLVHAQSSSPYHGLSNDPGDDALANGPRIVVHEPRGILATAVPAQRTPHDLLRAQSSDESLSSIHESLDLEDLALRQPAHGTIPSNVACTLYTTCDGSALSLVNLTVPYNDANSYQMFEDTGKEHVKDAYAEVLIGKGLKFTYGNCTIIGEQIERIGNPLTTQEEWRDVATKRSEIQALMKRASDGRKYIPRTALMRFTSLHNIREIIVQDPRLDLEAKEKEEFIGSVQQRAGCLLAMCVYAGLKMECLQKLLENGCNDTTFPLEESHCCHSRCAPDFDNMISNQGGFKTAQFDIIGQHQDFDRDVVIPFHYQSVDVDEEDFVREGRRRELEEETLKSHRERDLKQKKACCGSGAYSNVYRVRLDPDHHRLSKFKNIDFALKVFKDRPQRGDADFKQELKVLEKLRKYPHKHIVTHLATWTQDGKYYMLFPYAQCNLRQYMKWMHFGTPTKENIIWLLKQLRGLAAALKDIHNLSCVRLSVPAPSPTSNLAAPQPQMRESGWHHDLKPENILLYKNPGPKRGTFQISDFGSSKIHTYRSGSINTRSPNGTLTYEPPEAKSEGATSRPYDVWSLGCVFLELLIWAVLGFRSVEEFASERHDRRYPGSQTDILSDDSYWQMAEDGSIIVRKTVLQKIEVLKENVMRQAQQPFKEVLELILLMLDPDRRKRILALDLWNTLDSICKQKSLDLQTVTDDSMADGGNDGSASFLPRLSLNPIDRCSPDAFPDGSIYLKSNAGYVSGDFLTASPIDSHMQRRNSAGSAVSPVSMSPFSRNPSIASSNMSTHGHHGSVDGYNDHMDESR